MSAFDRIPERLRGGGSVRVVRIDDRHVAIVFEIEGKDEADRLENKALHGLTRGEFKMRLRGKVSKVQRS